MKRFIVVMIMVLLLVGDLFSQVVSQRIIPLDSHVYSDMDLLYLITGNGTPSNARPWTITEAHMILERIDRNQLDNVVRELFDSIIDDLHITPLIKTEDNFLLDLGFTYNFEAYYHSNVNDFNRDTDWIYGFEDRKPMAKLDIVLALDPSFYSFTDLQYSRNRFTDRDDFTKMDGTAPGDIGSIIKNATTEGHYATIVDRSYIYSQQFMTNVLFPTYDIDFQTPKRAVLSIGGSRWNFNLSRDKVRWGNGKSGNFIIHDHVDYQEFARLSEFSDSFKYDLLYVFFETNYNTSEGASADEEFRIFMAHRLEFRFFDRFTFAVSENLMYKNDVLNFRYFNPANIYHNLNNNSIFNAIAHVELDYSPFPGINIYGQYVLDQAVAPNESQAQADASGFLAGVEYAIPLSFGILSTSLEFAQTSPALYRRETVDFLMFRRYHGNGTSFVSHIDYIGYEYGGDVQLLQFDANLRILAGTNLFFRAVGMYQGETNYFTSNEDVNNNRDPAPSGNVITEKGILSVGGIIEIPQVLSWMDTAIWVRMDLIGLRNLDRTTNTYSEQRGDVQVTFGMSLNL
jgi:hypothetical protein